MVRGERNPTKPWNINLDTVDHSEIVHTDYAEAEHINATSIKFKTNRVGIWILAHEELYTEQSMWSITDWAKILRYHEDKRKLIIHFYNSGVVLVQGSMFADYKRDTLPAITQRVESICRGTTPCNSPLPKTPRDSFSPLISTRSSVESTPTQDTSFSSDGFSPLAPLSANEHSTPAQDNSDEIEFLKKEKSSLEVSLYLMADECDTYQNTIKKLQKEIQILKKENTNLKLNKNVKKDDTDISINVRTDEVRVMANEHPLNKTIAARRSYADVVKSSLVVKTENDNIVDINDVETVVIGTSLTDGLGHELNKQGTEATVYKYSGAEIPRIRERIPAILPKNKYVDREINCVLQVAGNDSSVVPASAVIGRYEDLIEDILSQCPKANIITSRIPARKYLNDPASTTDTMKNIEKVNTYLLTRSLTKGDISFMDVCPKEPELFNKDLIHFNRLGKLLYAQKIHAYLSGFHRRQCEKIS